MIRRQAVAVVLGLIAIFVLALVAGIGIGGNTPLEERAEGHKPAEDGRGISAATATLMAGSLAVVGTLLGAGLGLFGDRYLRHRGDIVCSSSKLDLTCYVQDFWDSTRPPNEIPFTRALVANERIMARAQHVIYRCDVKLFNGTEREIGG